MKTQTKLINIIILVLLITVCKTFSADYNISFSASGASTTYDSVEVKNISKGTTAIIPYGSDLQLSSMTTSLKGYKENSILIYPNPVVDESILSNSLISPANRLLLALRNGRSSTCRLTLSETGMQSIMLQQSSSGSMLQITALLPGAIMKAVLKTGRFMADYTTGTRFMMPADWLLQAGISLPITNGIS